MSNQQPKRYSVIYYKRQSSNKVHKGRGQSKLEGILHVFGPPSCQVRLYNEDDDEDSSSRNNLVSSCINRDISTKVFGDGCEGFQENDLVILPQFECEIMNCISETQLQSSKITTVTKSNTIVRKVNKTVVKSSLLQRKRQTNSNFVVPVKKVHKTSSAVVKNEIVSAKKSTETVSNQTNFSTVDTAKAPSSITTSNLFPGAIGQITIPSSIQNVLRPHQREGITFLWNCLTGASPDLKRLAKEREESMFNGAILADEMGLGKTLMTISTIYALNRKNRDQRSIVVCPSSLVSNWAKEFDKWLGKASQPKRVVIKGGEEALRLIKSFIPTKPTLTEVLIISYEIFRMHFKILSKCNKIQLMVVDEGHRLKNTSGSLTLDALNSLRCEARLLISGTPLQNNLSEYYNIVNFVNPNILGDLNSFRKIFERPITLANSKQATKAQKEEGNAQAKALEKLTSTFMIRRLQSEVLKSLLPPRNEFLLFAKPTKVQCDLYQSLTKNIQIEGVLNAGVSEDVLTVLMKFRKICTHPALLESTKSDNKDSLVSGKLFILEKLLHSIRSNHPNEKCVIVSNFTTALTIIQNMVEANKWSSLRLDGSTKERQSLVDSFNRCSADHSFVFLLSAKAGGCGLNLIGANRLIMFDPDWNPATDLQAMARIYRQGQKKPCYIYRLFTTGTIEEIILQRQIQKGNLATIAVDAQTSSGKQRCGFSEQELRDCFTLKRNCTSDTKLKLGNKWDNYEGTDCLRKEGCTDMPLLKVSSFSELSFVHICREDSILDDFDEIEKNRTDGNDNIEAGTKLEDSDYSSEEEF